MLTMFYVFLTWLLITRMYSIGENLLLIYYDLFIFLYLYYTSTNNYFKWHTVIPATWVVEVGLRFETSPSKRPCLKNKLKVKRLEVQWRWKSPCLASTRS
jgi:hypothetical protein